METVTPLLYKVRSETYLKEFSVQLMHVKKYLCYVVNPNKVIKSLTKTYAALLFASTEIDNLSTGLA